MFAFFLMAIVTLALIAGGAMLYGDIESRLSSVEQDLDDLGLETPQALQDMAKAALVQSEDALRIAHRIDARS